MNIRICPSCRARLSPTAQFCPECGTRVAEQPAAPGPAPQQRANATTPLERPSFQQQGRPTPPPPYGAPPPPRPGPDDPQSYQPYPPPGQPGFTPPPPRGSRLPLILMVLGLLIILGVGAGYLLTRDDTPSEEATRSTTPRSSTRRPQPTEEDEEPAVEATEEQDDGAAGDPEEPTEEQADTGEEPSEEPGTEPGAEPSAEPSEQPSAEPTEQPAGAPADAIFVDDFSDTNTGGWPDEDTDLGSYHYVDGTYQIGVNVPSKILWASTNEQYEAIDAAIDVKLLDGAEDNTAFGLILMENAANKLYVFQIRGDGTYAFRKSVGDGSWSNLIDWTESEAIRRGSDQVNRLRAVAKGSTIELYINDQQIDSVEDEEPYLEGAVGYGVSTFETEAALVEFDNFVLREP